MREHGFHGHVTIRERSRNAFYDLTCLMTLARDDEDVAGFERGNALANGFSAIADVAGGGTARHRLLSNLGRILAARIVVGDDDGVSKLRGSLAHEWTLSRVAIASATENDLHASQHMRP